MSIPSEIKEEVERTLENGAKSAVGLINDRPLAAVAIAAAFGFVIARFIF